MLKDIGYGTTAPKLIASTGVDFLPDASSPAPDTATQNGTVLGGNHEVGGEGGGQANFPDLPQVALGNAIDHPPTFLGRHNYPQTVTE